jgi:hypothetical protein
MGHPRFSRDEIVRRGEEWYEGKLRAAVETEENIGKIISIDIETGDYTIGKDPVETSSLLLKKHPDAALYGARIGYDAAYSFGAGLTRRARSQPVA